MIQLLATAARWQAEGGKHARAKLWRVVDAPSSTGKISSPDVERWVRKMLGCPTGFATRETVQRIFQAAAETPQQAQPQAPLEDGDESAHESHLLARALVGALPKRSARQTKSPEEMGYIEPGIAFWRLLLLVGCYLHIYLIFAPPDGANAWVVHDDFARLSVFLCRWGAPPLSAEEATDEAANRYGQTVRFGELCDWGVERLLSARRARGGALFFRELEVRLTAGGEGEVLRPRPTAVPLALL